jgi:hypothetical protein
MFEDLWLKVQEFILTLLRSFQNLSVVQRLVLAFCIVGIIPGFYLAKYSAFALWNLSYKDEIIVARPAFLEAKDLEIGRVGIINNGNGLYSIYAKVKNPNLDLAFQNGRYEFSFFNGSKQKIDGVTGVLSLSPNQDSYVIASRVAVSEPIISATLEMHNLNWQKRSEIPNIRLITPEPDGYNSLNPLAFVTEGAVINQSPYRLSSVRLVFLLLDQSDAIIGAGDRLEFNLNPNERRAYVQQWPNIYEDQVARVIVKAETNALDGNNVILPKNTNDGSDLSRPEVNNF